MSENEAAEVRPDKLTLMKERADIMGITYHPNIGEEKLQAKIDAKLKGENAQEDTPTPVPKLSGGPRFAPTPEQKAMIQRKEAQKLVRIRLTNMNPVNANIPAVIASVGNSQVGMIKKAVPFNVPWHVPQILVKYLQDKRYVTHYTVPDPRKPGKKIKRTRLVPEFGVEIMPPLTDREFKELKQRQAMAAGEQEQ